MGSRYSVSTVNVMLSAVNRFFAGLSWNQLRIRQVRTQRKVYRDQQREMTKADYICLLHVAEKSENKRLLYLMQTLAATGVRISELKFVTVESLKSGSVMVSCKGKTRKVFLPRQLREKLLDYCTEERIMKGPVFITKSGTPMDRSNIWRELQRLCEAAGIDTKKVYPHNFRHLFAVSYYQQEKDVVKLADLLGHSSIDTTRIYIMESGEEHERQIERLGLVI